MAQLSIEQKKVLNEALRLVPTPHNSQPISFIFDVNRILFLLNVDSLLPVIDPQRKDILLLVGEYLFVFKNYLQVWGFEIESFDFPSQDQISEENERFDKHNASKAEKNSSLDLVELGHLRYGEIISKNRKKEQNIFSEFFEPLNYENSLPFDYRVLLKKRRSYRKSFAQASGQILNEIEKINKNLFIIKDKDSIATIAHQFDVENRLGLLIPGFFAEFKKWLRMKRNHPRYFIDGMNPESMGWSKWISFFIPLFLNSKVFRMAQLLKIESWIYQEKKQIESASAIVIIYVPKSMSRIEQGGVFLQTWLGLTHLGLVGSPMSSLIESPEGAKWLSKFVGLPPDRLIVNAFRVGILPAGEKISILSRRSSVIIED